MFEKTAQRPGLPVPRQRRGRTRSGCTRSSAELYDAVVYSVGAQTDRRLGIPGEDLPGSWPATAFVAWYNGHPDFQELPSTSPASRAVVVGNGNVAVDVARMLALAEPEIAPTDTTDAAIEAILGSGIEEIVMLGRRGPAQASFTTPELEELGELADTDVVVDPAELELEPASEAALAESAVARNLAVLQRVRGARAEREAARAATSFPCLSGRDPRGGQGGGNRGRSQRARRRRRPRARGTDGGDGGDPVRRGLPKRRLSRRGRAGRAVRRGARDDANEAEGCWTRAANRFRGSTARAGSSAVPPGSSARTRRTRPKRSRRSSRTPPRALCRGAGT